MGTVQCGCSDAAKMKDLDSESNTVFSTPLSTECNSDGPTQHKETGIQLVMKIRQSLVSFDDQDLNGKRDMNDRNLHPVLA